MNYVFSTLSCDQGYAVYLRNADGQPILEKVIAIKGKANITKRNLETPSGVMTEVSDDDMELLLKDYHFNEHVKNGFITYESKKEDVDKVVKNMTKKDKSAPKTAEDIKAEHPEVTVGQLSSKKD